MGFDYTIISNNCWATGIYMKYRSIYKTPFINTYIHYNDFIKLSSDLKEYLNHNLNFVDIKKTKGYYTNMCFKYVAILKDIEIYFPHYDHISESEIIEKWKRRLDRVDYNKLIYKFGNLCEPLSKYELDFNICIKNFYECNNNFKISFTFHKYDYENNFVIKKKEHNDVLKLAENIDEYCDFKKLIGEIF